MIRKFILCLATVGFSQANVVEITLENGVSSPQPTSAVGSCPISTGMTAIETIQDETETTDWFKYGSCACTSTGKTPEAFWTADFVGGEFEVTEISILARRTTWQYDAAWDYLRGVQVFIDDAECYVIPQDSALRGTWHTFQCSDENAKIGSKITLQQNRDAQVGFCGIKLRGVDQSAEPELFDFIETCDYGQADIWSDDVCIAEIVNAIVAIGFFGGFFILCVVFAVIAFV